MSSDKVSASITVSIMECTEAELTAIEDAIYESIKPFIDKDIPIDQATYRD
jgi:hypothetical protein